MDKDQSEITRLSNKEKELYQLSRTFKALADSSQAILRSGDEGDYLNAVCRIIVENCGYAMAWIGLAEEDEGKTVRPVASAGFEAGYLESLDITWADTERGRGPTGTAIRTGKPYGCRNILTDPQFKPWREEAIKREYASSIALPLLDRGKAFGAVNIFSREPDAFSEEETKLLSGLVMDLASYGISAIRLRTVHVRAEEALQMNHDELEKRIGERTKELATSTERFRQTLDNLLEGCLILGFDWSYLYLNDAAARHGHQKREALLGRNLLGKNPGLEQSPIFTAYRCCMEKRIPQRFESAFSFEDGTTGWFEFRVEPVPEGIFVLSLDVTERKQAEAALVQAERALGEAKRLSDVGALAASVAHELRNPLGVIQMAAYNLRRKSQDPALEKHLANIEKKVMESDQIINNLLGYARIKMPLFQEVSIPDLVNECLADMAWRFQTDNITIHKDLKEIEGEKIQADPVQIKEIINNILANAYQALEEKKGQIQIRGSRTPEGGVEIRIKDNGGGIEKVDLERVFEPFFTRKSKGTGLGLSLSLELVRLHGGRIEIESEKGKGTAVTIHLPGRRKEP